MKYNYFLFIVIFIFVLFRAPFINVLNNINKNLLKTNNNLEINILKNELNNKNDEYQNLLNFKNNINIKENYIITNIYKNNYGFDRLLINGSNYKVGDEVINDKGLIGIIAKTNKKYSTINYLYKANIPVIINETKGKITGGTMSEIYINEVSNYNTINQNDNVYSIYGTYIGKVIKKETKEIDTTIVVRPINIDNIDYVAVISRY